MKFFSQFASIVLSSLLVLEPLWAQSPTPVGGAELQIHVQDSAQIFAHSGSQAAKGFTIQITDITGAGTADAAVVVRLPDDGATGTFSDGAHAAIAYTDGAGMAHFTPISWNAASGGVTIKITATKGDAHAGMLLDDSMASQSTGIPSSVTTATRVDADTPASLSGKQAIVAVTPAQPTIAIAPQQPGAAQSAGRALLPSPGAAAASEPTVSVINRGSRDKGDRVDTSGSHKKWIILAVVIAAGAAAGIALAGKGKSSSSSSSSSSTGVSIGSPTVSVGTPH